MASIFTRIIEGEIPCYKIAEDDLHLAFLDVRPVALGHVLVIPKTELDYIFDLDSEQYRSLWDFTRYVAAGLKAAIPCKRIGVAVIGLEVAHAHIHLVPLNSMDDINFSKEKLNPSREQLEQIRTKIAGQL
jgi:histidine triad (HIT) family protein